jgi:hypothetical protein
VMDDRRILRRSEYRGTPLAVSCARDHFQAAASPGGRLVRLGGGVLVPAHTATHRPSAFRALVTARLAAGADLPPRAYVASTLFALRLAVLAARRVVVLERLDPAHRAQPSGASRTHGRAALAHSFDVADWALGTDANVSRAEPAAGACHLPADLAGASGLGRHGRVVAHGPILVNRLTCLAPVVSDGGPPAHCMPAAQTARALEDPWGRG